MHVALGVLAAPAPRSRLVSAELLAHPFLWEDGLGQTALLAVSVGDARDCGVIAACRRGFLSISRSKRVQAVGHGMKRH